MQFPLRGVCLPSFHFKLLCVPCTAFRRELWPELQLCGPVTKEKGEDQPGADPLLDLCGVLCIIVTCVLAAPAQCTYSAAA